MRWTTRAGTPHHMEDKVHDTVSSAKNWLQNKIKPHLKWAARYNTEAEAELNSVKIAVDECVLASMALHATRHWEVTDDVTGVRFVFEIERTD